MKILFASFVLINLAFASDASQTDIVPRVVNFVIFFVLIYYLIASKVKAFFKDRQNSIAQSFENIQDKLKQAKTKKEESKQKLEHAKLKANDIIKDALKEAALMKEKLIEQHKLSVEILHKQKQEAQEVARKKMIRAVIEEELGKILASKELKTDPSVALDSMIKRMAS